MVTKTAKPKDTAYKNPLELLAHLEFLNKLIAYAADELGIRETIVLCKKAFAQTIFARLAITRTGFDFPDHMASKIEVTSYDGFTKRQQYRVAIGNFIAILNKRIPAKTLHPTLQRYEQQVEHQYNIPLSFDELLLPEQKPATELFPTFKRLAQIAKRSKSQAPARQTTINPAKLNTALTQVLALIPEGILVLSSNYVVQSANEQVLQLLDAKEVDVVGSNIKDILLLADSQGLLPLYTLFPKSTSAMPLYMANNIKLFTHAQTSYIVNLVTKPIVENNQITGYVMLLTQEDQKASESQNTDLISIAAHELKTPLTSLRGYLAILEDELSTTLSREHLLFLSRMAISTNQLLTLLENLLAFAKIESQTLKLQLGKTNITELLEKVVEDISPIAKAKGIVITIETPHTPLPDLVLDKIRIMEVITNLITNAVKYNHQNGGVWMHSTVENNNLVVEVSDNGIGIAEEAIPRLFHKYVQLHASPDNTEGTGLGLYIAREIITAHKGTIWVHSKLGYGSTFAFTIPLNLKPTLLAPQTPRRTFLADGHPLQLVSST